MKNINDNPNYQNLISMSNFKKINFVYNYTLENFKNLGCIYEIGTFCGSITQALALGSNDLKPKIYTVDLFQWDDDKKSKYPYLPFNIKDDFSNFVIKSLEHFDNIKIFKSNFEKLIPKNEIEIMFIDAPKRMKKVISFIKIFSNYWIENITKLLFDDYNQFLCYEIPSTLYPINKKFKFSTDNSNIVVCEVVSKDITKDEFKLMNIRNWDVNEIKNNWDEICSIGDNYRFLDKKISIFMHLIDNGFIDEGIKFFKDEKINSKKYEHKPKFLKNYSSIINNH